MSPALPVASPHAAVPAGSSDDLSAGTVQEPGSAGYAVATDTVAAFRGAILMLSRRLRSQRPGTEIAPAEAAVLGRVGNLGPITPGQLARLEHVQPPSMTRTLERLESKGLLTRLPDPDDRRQVLMVLSDAGREYVERTRELRTAWLVAQFEKLPPADLELIVQAVPALAVLAELP